MIPEYIIIHHSLTKDSETVSWGAIRKYHMETLGWVAVGYHWGLELIGDHYEILKGRMDDEVGAHCKEQGMNSKSLGICLVGNFDIVAPNNHQMTMLLDLTDFLMRQYKIPWENVRRHSEFAPYKSCPGLLFPWNVFVASLQ
jgi:N-acetylmuramoyl-L-alanine amidase